MSIFPPRRVACAKLRAIQGSVTASPIWTAVPARRLKDLDRKARLSENAYALTFDDGPDPAVTPALLELLEAHAALATFFMCGAAADLQPDLVREIADAGHSIGGHSWDHRCVTSLADDEWQRQVVSTHDLLADLKGSPVRWFRPPWGAGDRLTYTKLHRMVVTPVNWSIAGNDWKLSEGQEIAATVLRRPMAGAIVLLHDAVGDYLSMARPPTVRQKRWATVDATRIILQESAAQGLRPMPLDLFSEHVVRRRGSPRWAGVVAASQAAVLR